MTQGAKDVAGVAQGFNGLSEGTRKTVVDLSMLGTAGTVAYKTFGLLGVYATAAAAGVGYAWNRLNENVDAIGAIAGSTADLKTQYFLASTESGRFDASIEATSGAATAAVGPTTGLTVGVSGAKDALGGADGAAAALTRSLNGLMVAEGSAAGNARTLKEAEISDRQAKLNVAEAIDAKAAAVKKYGANSREAKQANIDLERAILAAADAAADLAAAKPPKPPPRAVALGYWGLANAADAAALAILEANQARLSGMGGKGGTTSPISRARLSEGSTPPRGNHLGRSRRGTHPATDEHPTHGRADGCAASAKANRVRAAEFENGRRRGHQQLPDGQRRFFRG